MGDSGKYGKLGLEWGKIGEILGIGFWVGEMVEMIHKPGFRLGVFLAGGWEIGDNVGNQHFGWEKVVENVELRTSRTGNIR